MPVVGQPEPRDALEHPATPSWRRDIRELEQLLAAAHRRLDERGVPRTPPPTGDAR